MDAISLTARTSVLAVGLERYNLSPEWDLPGAAGHAIRFVEWAIKQGVSPERIHLGCTWLDITKADVVERLGVRLAQTENESLIDTIDELMHEGGDLLLVYWCGHGVAGDRLERRLLTSGASQHNLTNRYVTDLQMRLQSHLGNGFERQVFIIDACANIMPNQTLPNTHMQRLEPRAAIQDFYFSTDIGEYAKFDRASGTAAYSSVILSKLEECSDEAFPPDFKRIFDATAQQLELNSKLFQHPVQFSVHVDNHDTRREFAGLAGADSGPRSQWAVDLIQLHESVAAVLGLQCPPLGAVAATAHVQLLDVLDQVWQSGLDLDLIGCVNAAAERAVSLELQQIEWLVETSAHLDWRHWTELLEDMWMVHEHALKHLPHLVPRLCFLVHSPGSNSGEMKLSSDAWAEGQEDFAAASDFLGSIKIRHETDPHGELLARITSAPWEQADPIVVRDTLVQALLECLAGTEQKYGLRHALLRSNVHGHVPLMLTRFDREPTEISSGAILTGQQPTLANLRSGYFARALNLDWLETQYWEWFAKLDGTTTPVATFWITGPSGSGKSILLLQLLARLNERSAVTAELLSNNSEILDSVKSARVFTRSRHVVIGLDDPFELVDGDGAGAWRSLTQNPGAWQSARCSTVVLLCCAPTDLHNRFRKIKPAAMPEFTYENNPYDEAFRDNLRTWYPQRTGSSAPESQKLALPAQMFFEWSHGEGISDFVRKFRTRIESGDSTKLAAFIYQLLAVNRLYVGYPAHAVASLDSATQDSLSILSSDHHLSVGNTGRPGYWFGHPHLVDKIYRIWFDDWETHTRLDHLRKALDDAIRFDHSGRDSIFLVQTLTAAASESDAFDASERITATEAHTLLKEQLSGTLLLQLSRDQMHPAALATWIAAQRVIEGGATSMDDVVTIGLSRFRMADISEAGIDRLACELARHPAVPATEVWAVLDADTSWRGWVDVVRQLMTKPMNDVNVMAFIKGIRTHRNDWRMRELLVDAVRTRSLQDLVAGVASELLHSEAADPTSELGRLAEACVGRGLLLDTAAEAWVSGAHRRSNGLALAVFWRRPFVTGKISAVSKSWVSYCPDHQNAGVVLARVLNWSSLRSDELKDALTSYCASVADTPPRLIKSIVDMLGQDHRAWTRLLYCLGAAQLREPVVGMPIRQRLMKANPDAEIAAIYTYYVSALGAMDDELANYGHRLLAALPINAPYLFPVLIAHATVPHREVFARLAIDWLVNHQDNSAAWGRIVPRLEATSPTTLAEIAEETVVWVKFHGGYREGSYVINSLLRLSLVGEIERSVVDVAKAWVSQASPNAVQLSCGRECQPGPGVNDLDAQRGLVGRPVRLACPRLILGDGPLHGS